ncbi:MAG: phosphatase PAP2 family protein [Pseudobdellovibrionaceae bacterium]
MKELWFKRKRYGWGWTPEGNNMKANNSNRSLYHFLPEKLRSMVNRWQDFSPHTIAIILKSSFGILCLGLFVRLTFSISPQGDIQTLDESILKWIETLRTPFWNAMMLDITALGGLALTVVLGTLSVAIFFLARDPAAAIHLILTSTGGYYIAIWSKNIISRPRPSIIPQLITASGLSYPSGHAVLTASLYLTMAILACRHFKSYASRMFLIGLAGFMIALISFSRIYLGVHYPSDTLSGALIGASWALFLAALFSKTHFSK